MKLRKLKKHQHAKLDHMDWLAMEENTRMYFIRDIKPCKSYSPWCGDCNAVLFRQVMGRFPHTIIEFNEFENKQQEGAE